MIEQWAAALEATVLAGTLRNSVWSYPLVNAGHIFGVALLVGSIVPLDLRLLGAWRSSALEPLWKVLTRTAAVGLVLALVFGALLVITRASESVASKLFIAKMAVVGLAAANALLLRRRMQAQIPRTASPNWQLPNGARLAAAFSLALWLSALTLGRLVGYF
jgi:hypothetical protein